MAEKLNWSRMDDHSFQRLCNDLLAADIRDPRFVPHAPGGKEPFDAQFEGSYGGLDGKWGFDPKFRRPKLGKKNVASLKRELSGYRDRKGLLRKAEEEGRDFLVLLTNVHLTDTDRKELEGLAEGRPFRLLLWDEERIRTLLVAHPHIRLYHFEGPSFPLFQAPHRYFESNLKEDEDRFITHLAPLQARNLEVETYRAFVAGSRRILTVYAASGMGKSRLLLEFARVTDSQWIPLFLQPEGKVVEDHLAELCPNRRYVLFIDDCHRHLARLSEILVLLGKSDYYAGLKVVMGSRLAFRRQIEAELAYRDPGEQAEPMFLQPMEQEALQDLIRWQVPNVSTSTVEALAALAGGSPLLALAAGKLLLGGKPLQELLQPGALRKGFFEAPLTEFVSERYGPPEETRTLKELLVHLAVLSPLDERDHVKWQGLSEWLGISLDRVRELSDEIREAGFLERIGRKLRVVPDILGDYLISSACLDPSGGVLPGGRDKVRRWFELAPEETLINCADLGFWFQGSGSILLEDIFDGLRSQAIAGDRWKRHHLLDLISPVASRFPRETLELTTTMLDHPLGSGENGGSGDAEVRGEIAPVLGRVARTFEFIEPAMEVLQRLIHSDPVKTPYETNRPDAVLAAIVGFDHDKPLAFNRRALEVLKRWWEEDLYPDDRPLTLRSSAVLLRPSIQIWRGTATGISISSAVVSPSLEVRELRCRALALMEQGLTIREAAVRAETYKELRDWLQYSSSPPPPPDAMAAASKMVEEECLSIFPRLEERVAHESDPVALAELEDLLWTWWLRGTGEVVRKAGGLLTRIPRSEEFIRYRSLVHPSNFEDLAPEKAARATTPEKRNEVWDRAIRLNRERWTDHIDRLAQDIRTIFPMPDSLITYLDSILTRRPGGTTARVARLLLGIGRFHPEFGSALLRHPDFPRRATSKFTGDLLAGLKIGDPGQFANVVKELAPDLGTAPPKTLEEIVWACAYGDPQESDLDLLRKAARRTELTIRKIIASRLHGYMERFRAETMELLLTLARPPVTSDLAKKICEVLSGPRDLNLYPSDLQWAKQLLDSFIECPDFGPEQYYCRKLQRNVAQSDPHWYLSWIEKRFEHMARLGVEGGYFPIPSGGLREIVAGWERRADYPDLLRRVRDNCRSGDRRAHDYRRLFAAIANPYVSEDILDEAAPGEELSEQTNPVAEILQEWIASGDGTLLSDAADLIGVVPRTETTYDLIVEALSAAEQMGQDVLKEVESSLSTVFRQLTYSRRIGEPSPAHSSIAKDLDGLLRGRLPRPAERFFRRMKNWAISEMERHRTEDEELRRGVR